MGRKKKASSRPPCEAHAPLSELLKSWAAESSKRQPAPAHGQTNGIMTSSKGIKRKHVRRNEGELTINKEFAERYEASKRKQLLSTVPAALLEGSSRSESSSEEEEDEFAEQLTKGVDRRVRETLDAIRNKDPRIYDKSTKFFDEDIEPDGDNDGEDGDMSDEETEYDSDREPVAGWETIADAAKADIAKMTLKDYVRETLLKDGKLSDSEEETADARADRAAGTAERRSTRDFGEVDEITPVDETNLKLTRSENRGDGDDESDEDDFFTKKDKSVAEIEAEEKDFEEFLRKQTRKTSQKAGEELLLHSYLENEKPDEKERFLRDFVLNNGWLDKNAADAPDARDYEIEIDRTDPNKAGQEDDQVDEDEFDEKVNEFEATYNFRFEDPDGAQIVSHARTVPDSMRRQDDKRKRARQARKLRKQREKLAKTEEIKHLKNLKKNEVKARLLAIEEAAGDGIDVSGIDLDGDFDPEEFNRQMESKFGEDYYSQKDEDMKKLTKEGVAVASERRLPTKRTDDLSEDIREDVNKLMDEYYNLDYEDIVGGVPMRFNYKKVEPESFNMTPDEILSMEEKELNRIVSLKYLAPYRSSREVKKQAWRVHDMRRKERRAKSLRTGSREENDHADVNDSLSRHRRKRSETGKRKRSRQNIQQGEPMGRSRIHAEAAVKSDDANGSCDGREGERQRPSKKRKRKKHSQSDAVEGLSTSRREAYSIT